MESFIYNQSHWRSLSLSSVDRRRDSFNSLLSDHHLSLSRTGEEEHPRTEARVGELINYIIIISFVFFVWEGVDGRVQVLVFLFSY